MVARFPKRAASSSGTSNVIVIDSAPRASTPGLPAPKSAPRSSRAAPGVASQAPILTCTTAVLLRSRDHYAGVLGLLPGWRIPWLLPWFAMTAASSSPNAESSVTDESRSRAMALFHDHRNALLDPGLHGMEVTGQLSFCHADRHPILQQRVPPRHAPHAMPPAPAFRVR